MFSYESYGIFVILLPVSPFPAPLRGSSFLALLCSTSNDLCCISLLKPWSRLHTMRCLQCPELRWENQRRVHGSLARERSNRHRVCRQATRLTLTTRVVLDIICICDTRHFLLRNVLFDSRRHGYYDLSVQDTFKLQRMQQQQRSRKSNTGRKDMQEAKEQ
jgi:hypothetical protein